MCRPCVLQTTKIPSETSGAGATVGEGHEFDSCIQLLNGRMQVQWEAILEGVIIRLSARMDENEYMSFGISGAEGRTKMIGADVAVAYFNSEDNKFYAEDYILNAKSQVCEYRISNPNIFPYLNVFKCIRLVMESVRWK